MTALAPYIAPTAILFLFIVIYSCCMAEIDAHD